MNAVTFTLDGSEIVGCIAAVVLASALFGAIAEYVGHNVHDRDRDEPHR